MQKKPKKKTNAPNENMHNTYFMFKLGVRASLVQEQ